MLYFVDTFANYHDPQLGEALVAVLEHNGIGVYVHPGQVSSGMPMIALGTLGRARKHAAKNVALLAEAVRQGYHIVATEPSAVICLTHEYPELINDDDARLVAENSSEACAYLWRLHQAGKLQLDFRPVNVALGYHLPCHLRALGIGAPGREPVATGAGAGGQPDRRRLFRHGRAHSACSAKIIAPACEPDAN